MREDVLIAELMSDVLARHHSRTPGGIAGQGDAVALWHQLEELGLTLAGVPDALGGAGATAAAEFAILREAGRNAVSLPLLETGLLAGWLMAAAGRVAEAGAMTVAPTGFADQIIARRGGRGAVLAGRSHHTPFASTVSRVVVCGSTEADERIIAVVPRAAIRVTGRTNIAGEPRDLLVFDDVRAEIVHLGVEFRLEQLLRRAVIGRCAMTAGALAAVRDLTARHVTTREQFGRPLRKFQAVEHQLAVLARECALADAATEAAVASLVKGRELSLAEVAAAKVVCGRAAAAVVAIAHQLHGAIGITREYPLHRYTSLLLAWREDYGSERSWATALGLELRAAPSMWERLAATGSLREPGKTALDG